jgi:hypothetical protein
MMPLACARGAKVTKAAKARSFPGDVLRICTVVFQFCSRTQGRGM